MSGAGESKTPTDGGYCLDVRRVMKVQGRGDGQETMTNNLGKNDFTEAASSMLGACALRAQ